MYSSSQFVLATLQVLNGHMWLVVTTVASTLLSSNPNAQVLWIRITESELEVNSEIKPLFTNEKTEVWSVNGLLAITQLNLGCVGSGF